MTEPHYSPDDPDRTTGELPGPAPEERPHPEGRRNGQGQRIDPEAEAEPRPREAVISALVDNEPGVLARVAGLVSRRQFNIESLTVGPTTVEGHARITMVVEESDPGIDQIERQMAKLKPVISVGEIDDEAVTSELVLIKVNGDDPEGIRAVTEMFDGRTVDVGAEAVTVQITGDEDTVDRAIAAYHQFGVREIARTGQTALASGVGPTAPGEEPAESAKQRTLSHGRR